MNLSQEIEISLPQAEAMARALYTVASSDGIHEREAALVASFWADVGGGPTALAGLARSGKLSGQELASAIGSGELAKLFLKTAFLLAWADGKFSAEERAVVDDYVAHLGISKQEAEESETSVKEYMLSHLSHLANTEAAVEVARTLKL